MLERFRRSAEIGIDNWRDPQHDLDALRLATPEEKAAIERFLVTRGVNHFMDAEALALLDTPSARETLANAFRTGSPQIRAAVAHLAPDIVCKEERITELLNRIATCNAYQGLSLTLHQIQSDHPSAVIEAMLRRIVRDPGTVAVNFAALLFHLSGITDEPFDWSWRMFFLRFNPGDEVDRQAAFVHLCEQINQDASRYDDLWP